MVWSSWSSGPRQALPQFRNSVIYNRERRRAVPGPGKRNSALDLDAHGAGGTGDDLLGRLDRGGVQVGHLGLRDVADLRRGDAADLGLVRLGAALVHARGLLDQLGGGRCLGDEGEGPVLVDRDLYRDDVAPLAFRRRV